jgi:hypothetical protein
MNPTQQSLSRIAEMRNHLQLVVLKDLQILERRGHMTLRNIAAADQRSHAAKADLIDQRIAVFEIEGGAVQDFGQRLLNIDAARFRHRVENDAVAASLPIVSALP